ncbi:SRPBCC domain-containing protein [Flavobacterium sp.]|uniref:SRPBCC domain-containing protein n=1 Tax=Flavobacterium sp. TaxID=239 RepID=UPI002604DBBD|nr:SRPBCC domain-containing protein [Flavobacterium sp.]
METENLIASAEVNIEAPISKVWDALVNPEIIKQYMFGATVTSNWTEGSPITWKGEWEGKPYEDKGRILRFVPESKLHYTHYSSLSGPDSPENYHTVTIDLYEIENKTVVFLTQDHNNTIDERLHSEKNWSMMLSSLKELLEKK